MDNRDRMFDEKVVELKRVSRTVKGGRRISFRALVIVGDRKGRVGLGVSKANDVSQAIKKATSRAKKLLFDIRLNEANSVKKEVYGVFGASKVLLKPAPEGTSIISGGVVRTVAELAGIRNLVGKSIGSSNKINLAKATIHGLLEASKDDDNSK